MGVDWSFLTAVTCHRTPKWAWPVMRAWNRAAPPGKSKPRRCRRRKLSAKCKRKKSNEFPRGANVVVQFKKGGSLWQCRREFDAVAAFGKSGSGIQILPPKQGVDKFITNYKIVKVWKINHQSPSPRNQKIL